MWTFFYTLAFGLTGAYCAKKMNKNPYLWFAIGCFFKGFLFLVILLMPIFSALSFYFLKKAIFKHIKTPSSSKQDSTTIDVPAFAGLSAKPEAEKSLWYYLTKESQTIGPMSFHAFYRNWKEGKISEDTYIWNETLVNWAPFQEIFPETKM